MLIGILLLASITDLRKSKIPNYITLTGIGIGFIYLLFYSPDNLIKHMAVCLIILIITIPMFVIKAMGAGDIKLMIMISLFLDFKDLLLSLLTGLGAAVVYSVIRLLMDKEIKKRIRYLSDYIFSLAMGGDVDGYIKEEDKKNSKNYNIHLSIWITLGVIISYFCKVI